MEYISSFWFILTATHLKKIGMVQQKAGKVIGINQGQMVEYLTAEYKRGILEKQSLSVVKMGRDSPIYDTSPSTVRNIIKRFRIRRSVCAQGTRPKVQTGCMWSLSPQLTALKTGMIIYSTSLSGLRNTSRNPCLWTQLSVQSTNAS